VSARGELAAIDALEQLLDEVEAAWLPPLIWRIIVALASRMRLDDLLLHEIAAARRPS
jgi:hypothetical protein